MMRAGSKVIVLQLVLGLGTVGLAMSARADDAAGRALVQQAVDALPRVPFQAKVKLVTDEGTRELELDQKVVDGARKGYLEVLGPDDLKGIRHLFIEPKEGPPTQ